MFNRKYFTVQCPVANGGWMQCGNERYMNLSVAEDVYKDCSDHIAVALFEIDQRTGEFENNMIRSNF